MLKTNEVNDKIIKKSLINSNKKENELIFFAIYIFILTHFLSNH